MTIDEMISKLKIECKEQKDSVVYLETQEEYAYYIEPHRQAITACEQLAEWLELLKWYQQGMEDIPSESGVLPKDVYRAGYIKGIDDFVETVRRKFPDDRNAITNLEIIAEQLKKGSADNEL